MTIETKFIFRWGVDDQFCVFVVQCTQWGSWNKRLLFYYSEQFISEETFSCEMLTPYGGVQTITQFFTHGDVGASPPLTSDLDPDEEACHLVECPSMHRMPRKSPVVARLDLVVKPQGQWNRGTSCFHGRRWLSRQRIGPQGFLDWTIQPTHCSFDRESDLGIPGLDCPPHCISASPTGSSSFIWSQLSPVFSCLTNSYWFRYNSTFWSQVQT